MKLDVGCGHLYEGDVNVDLFIKATPHRSGDQRKCNDIPLNAKKIPNLIRADACHLPFKNNFFEDVYSKDTIEHVVNPFLMLRELIRVAKDCIVIIAPHRFYSRKNRPLHINQFNIKWFAQALKKLGYFRVSIIKYSEFKYFPNKIISLIRIPQMLEVKICKRWK